MTQIDSFDTLLQAASEQPERQRFLLIFAQTVLPEDATGAQTQRFETGQGGGLVPVMYVDKGEAELGGFDALVAEAEQMDANWDMVLVGCMSGRGGEDPAPESVDEALKHIVETIRAGGTLSHLAAFDRNGAPVRFE